MEQGRTPGRRPVRRAPALWQYRCYGPYGESEALSTTYPYAAPSHRREAPPMRFLDPRGAEMQGETPLGCRSPGRQTRRFLVEPRGGGAVPDTKERKSWQKLL
jgi:hypothetical protein